MSHLVSYAMLTRGNKGEAAVHGCYFDGSLYHQLSNIDPPVNDRDFC